MRIYGYFYRLIMRFAHYFNWHYAPPLPRIDDAPRSHCWCQWCGLRGDVIELGDYATIERELQNYTVGEDMICPVLNKHCDDECCPVGAECNMAGGGLQSEVVY